MQNKQKSWVSVREAAKRMGFTTKYVRDLLYEERLRGAKKRGRAWQIPVAAIEEQLTKRGSHNG